MKGRSVVVACAVFLAFSAHAALSVVVQTAITEMTQTILQLLGLLTAAGATVWAAKVVAQKFIVGLSSEGGWTQEGRERHARIANARARAFIRASERAE